MADPGFYQGPKEAIADSQKKITQLNTDLQTAYARWEELESKVG